MATSKIKENSIENVEKLAQQVEQPTVQDSSENFTANQMKSAAPWIALAVVIVAGMILGIVQYRKVQSLNKQLSELKTNPQEATQKQNQEIIDKVGKLMILPEGEQPTVATVTDPEMLKNQSFFAHAEIGDKVLIYTNSKKAILYSEKLNKIKEVAPVNLGDAAAGTQPVPKK